MKVIEEEVGVLKIEDVAAKQQDGLLRLAEENPGDADADKRRCGVSEVVPWLLVGGAAALSAEAVSALGVTLVLSAAPELPDTPLPAGVAFRRLPLADRASQDLAPHLDAAADAIEQERSAGGRTLVHCVAGVSRSAALALAHLVKHGRLPLAAAFRLLRRRRPCARPSAAFFRQLIDFERRTLGAASVRMVRCPATAADIDIPDVYEPDYRRAAFLLQHGPGRAVGRH